MGNEVGAAQGDKGTGGEGTGIVDQSEQIGNMLSNFTPDVEDGGGESTEVVDAAEKGEKSGKDPLPGEGGEGEVAPLPGGGDTSDTIKSLSATVKALTDKISAMEAGAKPTKEENEAAKGTQKPSIFIKDKAEYDALFEKPELLNEVLNKVADAGGERIIKALPKIIRAVVTQQVEMQTETAKFFTDNKDLLPHRQFASFVANDMIGQNPNWTLTKLYTELGGEVRKRLGVKAGAVDKTKGKGTGAFPGTKGGGARQVARGTGQQTPLEAEIKDLIE
jgi:hypothetical protein